LNVRGTENKNDIAIRFFRENCGEKVAAIRKTVPLSWAGQLAFKAFVGNILDLVSYSRLAGYYDSRRV
jgi:hypothetical protein